MPTPESSRSMQEAEKEFLAWRRRREAGERVDLEAICAARPELASDLRLLGSAHGLEPATASVSFRDLVMQELGQGAILTLEQWNYLPERLKNPRTPGAGGGQRRVPPATE